MKVENSGKIMERMKKEYERSERKDRWRVLAGRNPKDRYDMFISSEDKVWQLKTEYVAPFEVVGVGCSQGKLDDDIARMMSKGSRVPFGLISPLRKDLAIAMAGTQQYSSDAVETMSKDYISSKQAKLDEKLDRELEKLMENASFRKRYRGYKDYARRSYV